MRWKGRRQSSNVEDRRGQGGGGMMMRTGGRPVALGGGCGTLVIILLLAYFFNVDPMQLLETASQMEPPVAESGSPAQSTNPNDEIGAFVRTLKGDAEEVWSSIFAESGRRYEPARLVLYSGYTRMPGGVASAATGPFYLPYDRTVYLDTSFFDEMRNRFRAGGDFAYAYVLTHEIGHHVQNLLGYTEQVHRQKDRLPAAEYNRLSVRLELQADFLAGVWAHHAEERWQILEEGDVEEAMNAANAIGDDRLQRQAQGRVVPDAFTHGTSEQRMRWFMKGLRSGEIEDGDTFSIRYQDL
ncbi:MAG: neutral zinc metallopeptidase [Verrucomicrobiae bacterium]|nr:neutral zinc metallopeptidase [Verrucomicrobiae bacterium]